MTNRISSLILAGFVASTMLATSVMAQPAPSKTVMTTTPAELRNPAMNSNPVASTPVAVEPAAKPAETAVKTPAPVKKVKKHKAKHKGSKTVSKTNAKAATTDATTTK